MVNTAALPVRLPKQALLESKGVLREGESLGQFFRLCLWEGIEKRKKTPDWVFAKIGRPRKYPKKPVVEVAKK